MIAGSYVRRPYRRSRGQVLIVVLLSMALLVGLVFFVYNVGEQVNVRLEMQGAADATAISGSTWMARSMNVVAMNNVTQSRLIALVAALDSLPLAAEMTVAEETGDDRLPDALREQLNRGVPRTRYEREDFLYKGLVEIHRQMNEGLSETGATHLDLIESIDKTLDQDDERETESVYNVKEATEWSGAGGGRAPQGAIWQAIVALDQFSQATAASAGVLAQADAVRFGEADKADTAFLVPILPYMPARRGVFEDFGPVLEDHLEIINDPGRGRLGARLIPGRIVERLSTCQDVLTEIERIDIRGGAIPDFTNPHRLGPFARLYGWRTGISRQEGEWWMANQRSYRIGYTTYGPLENALRTLGFGLAGQREGLADTSRFEHHLRRIATLKLAYMLGLDHPKEIQYADKWITDYDDAVTFDAENPDHILRTRYYRVGVASKVHWDSASWLTGVPGESAEQRTYHSREIHPVLGDPTQQPLWSWISDRRGWHPNPGGGHERLSDHVWRRRQVIQVRDYQPFNWPPRPILDENGNIIGYDRYTLYTFSWHIWGGAEVRDPVAISNPLAGANRSRLPAPMLLDTSMGDYDPDNRYDDPHDAGVRRELFSFLGVVRKKNPAPVWPQRFTTGNPLESMVTVAQVELFNNRSWDLWTQKWRVQLVPVTQWADWVRRLELGLRDVGLAEGGMVEETEVQDVFEYMRRLDERLAELYMRH